MGSRNLSSSFSFAKDILRNATDKLNEFVDSALTTYEESTGRKLKHGDDGIHLAGGSDFCMDIRRYDQVSPVSETEHVSMPEVEEIAEPIVVPEEVHIQEMEEVSAIERAVSENVLTADDVAAEGVSPISDNIVEDEIPIADNLVAEDVHAIQVDVINDTPIIEEQPFSETEYHDNDKISYGGPTGDTEFDEKIAIQAVPEMPIQAATSTAVETMPSFHQFIDEDIDPSDTCTYAEPIDDGVDFKDLYEDIVAECIVYDIMPRLMAEEKASVPEYVISEIGSFEEGSTVIDVPEIYVPDYVISEIESPSEVSTVIDVPVIYALEYVISEIASPTEETTEIDVPEPVVEVSPIIDHVTTTTTFRFGFAPTSMPGRTGFSFGMGKRNKVDEFINGPKD